MDYLITTDDGSKHLAHSGTKGMKWGVWNEETKRKYGYGGGSARGDKLRTKAEKARAKAEHARSNTAFLDRAAKVHSTEITKHYSKANAHLVKGLHESSKASSYSSDAQTARAHGDEKKAKKLEKKAEKFAGKAEREKLREQENVTQANRAANRFEREQIARMELAKESSKQDAKAAKLEVKAAKADAKADAKAEKAYNSLTEYSEHMLGSHRAVQKIPKFEKAVAESDAAYKKINDAYKQHYSPDHDGRLRLKEIDAIKNDPKAPRDVKSAIREYERAEKNVDRVVSEVGIKNIDRYYESGANNAQTKALVDHEYAGVTKQFLKTIQDSGVKKRSVLSESKSDYYDRQEARIRETMTKSLKEVGASDSEAAKIIDDLTKNPGYKNPLRNV